ncbi:MAG: ArsA family ATPase [Deltaproteobacteria bacterium]|nr:ArsA family ATPase [Deltaproteobacteria bacterium]
MPPLLTTYHILLTCGTGGVGKTTLAAALGVAAARAGRRTLVLTIDPARRLADALGIKTFSDQAQRVWPKKGAKEAGTLDAMMLDVKGTFDRVIERYAPDRRAAQTILNNPLYQQLSTAIAGSQEYMAMERLYEVVAQDAYDLIILDTPPTQHALDFFQAPQRMVRALSDSMLKLFTAPALAAGKFGAKLFARGADRLMQLFGRVTGVELLQEMADLIQSTVGLFGGFAARADAVHQLLRAPTTGIVLVVGPQRDLLDDAQTFATAATEQGMHLAGVILNRAMPAFAAAPTLPATLDPALAARLRDNDARCRDVQRAQQAAFHALQAALPPDLPHWTIPERATPPQRLDDLAECVAAVSIG